jgi:hypothetical protein
MTKLQSGTSGSHREAESTDAPERSAAFADTMIALAVGLWALAYPVTELALKGWEHTVFFLLAARFWVAFLLLLPFALRSHSIEEIIDHLWPGFVVGITLVAAYVPQTQALTFPGKSGEVAFITAFSSMLVPILLWMFVRTRYVIRRARRKFKRLHNETEGARDWFERLRTNPTLLAIWKLCHGTGRTFDWATFAGISTSTVGLL